MIYQPSDGPMIFRNPAAVVQERYRWFLFDLGQVVGLDTWVRAL